MVHQGSLDEVTVVVTATYEELPAVIPRSQPAAPLESAEERLLSHGLTLLTTRTITPVSITPGEGELEGRVTGGAGGGGAGAAAFEAAGVQRADEAARGRERERAKGVAAARVEELQATLRAADLPAGRLDAVCAARVCSTCAPSDPFCSASARPRRRPHMHVGAVCA